MNLAESPFVMALGWTLLHFVWQGLAIALFTAVALYVLKDAKPQLRYALSLVALGAMVIAFGATFLIVVKSPEPGLAELVQVPASLRSADLWTPVLPWLTLFWFTGTLAFQTRLILHWSRARYLKEHGVTAAPAQWGSRVRSLVRGLGISRPVRLFQSSLARVPLVMGWLRPVILVPASAFSGLSPAQLETILIHELAHVRRHDYLVNLVQSFIETLLFYHPAVWWLSNRVRVEREYCCDDVAVSQCRDPLGYARALSSLEGLKEETCQASLASSGGPLMKRILRIVGLRSRPAQRLGGWPAPLLVAATLIAVAAALSFTPGVAQEIKKVKQKEESSSLNQVDASCLKIEQAMKELELKREQLVKAMKAEGVSEKELQAALTELDAKKSILSDKMQDLKEQAVVIKKMQAKGMSEKEIQFALQEKASKETPPSPAESLETKVKEMKEQGASDEKIKQFVMEWKKKEAAQQEHQEELKKKATALVEDLKKKGLSEKEIQKELTAFFEKNGVKVEVKGKEGQFKIKKLDE